MSSFRSDGRAVYVVLAGNVLKNAMVVAQGWVGIAQEAGSTGETIALEIEREHEIVVPGGVTAAVGDLLYVTSAGVITNTSAGNRLFGKVTVAKDANNNVSFKFLPQMTA